MFARPFACAFLLLASATAQDTVTSEAGFMTIQTSVPSSLATEGPLTNPLRTTETIPQLTFCDGVYTNTPCSSATGQMSIPQGETPEPTSASASSTGASASKGSSSASQSSTGSRPAATSSASGSVETSPTATPGAAASVFKRDGSFVWAAALSGLSATLGFAWTLL